MVITHTYTELDQGYRVEVTPVFIPERSSFDQEYYFFAYTICIENIEGHAATLQKRHWIIRNGHGEEEHVVGDGVVGEFPYLEPGQTYRYTSFCPLPTQTGNMRGKFTFIDDQGREFEITIPVFFLSVPKQ